MMVGRLLSYWEGNFSGAILNFWGVVHSYWYYDVNHCYAVYPYYTLGVDELMNMYGLNGIPGSSFVEGCRIMDDG